MFLDAQSWMTRSGEQRARGSFLLLMRPDAPGWPLMAYKAYPLRGLVLPRVTLRQSGHWMVGSAQIEGHRIPLSGAYGSDGLYRSVPVRVYALGTDVPPALVEAWNQGGGHNSSGTEGPGMAEWARSLPRRKRPHLPYCGSCEGLMLAYAADGATGDAPALCEACERLRAAMVKDAPANG